MADGILINAAGTIVSTCYGYTDAPPAGQTFIACDPTAYEPGMWFNPLIAQAGALIANGLTITPDSSAGLAGVYGLDAITQQHVSAEMVALLNSNFTTFADGGSIVAWPDLQKPVAQSHTFTPAQFRLLAVGIGQVVAGAIKVQAGTSTILPSPTLKISV